MRSIEREKEGSRESRQKREGGRRGRERREEGGKASVTGEPQAAAGIHTAESESRRAIPLVGHCTEEIQSRNATEYSVNDVYLNNNILLNIRTINIQIWISAL